jgi:hypothetical protein
VLVVKAHNHMVVEAVEAVDIEPTYSLVFQL